MCIRDSDEPIEINRLGVEIPPARVGRSRVARVLIETDSGRREVNLAASAGPNGVSLPEGETTMLRLTVVAVQGGANALEGPGIAEITIPGLEVQRPLVTPADRPEALDGSAAPLVVLDRDRADPFDLTRDDEEVGMRRVVRLPDAATFDLGGAAAPVAGDPLIRLVDSLGEPGEISITTTSTWGGLPNFSARHLLDGDPDTSWISDPSNPVPAVTLRWDEPTSLSELRLTPTGAPTEAPTSVRLESPAGDREVVLGAGGQGSFGALVTDEVTVSFPTAVDPLANASRAVGIAELGFTALDDLDRPSLDAEAAFTRPCGEGPTVTIDDQVVETSLSGRVRDLLEARPLAMAACIGPIEMDAGRHEIEAPAVDLFDPSRLTFTPSVAGAADTASTLSLIHI